VPDTKGDDAAKDEAPASRRNDRTAGTPTIAGITGANKNEWRFI